jgi:hypothetical protein
MEPRRQPGREVDEQVTTLVAALVLLAGTILLGLLGIEFPWTQ